MVFKKQSGNTDERIAEALEKLVLLKEIEIRQSYQMDIDADDLLEQKPKKGGKK